MKEIILTGLAAIVCCVFLIRHSIPLLLEWLDTMSLDETEFRKEDGNGCD